MASFIRFNSASIGALTGLRFANRLQLRHNFDTNGRMQTINLSTAANDAVFAKHYRYDATGNITGIRDAVNTSHTEQFSYDARHRLQQASGHYGQVSYQLDSVGNRSQRSIQQAAGADAKVERYHYAQTSNRLLSVSSGPEQRTLAYDATGNIITDQRNQQQRRLHYGVRNRLQAVKADKLQTEYRYNAKGQRVVKRVLTNNNWQSTHFHYDRQNRLMAETDSNGNSVREYLYFGGRQVAMVDNSRNKPELLFIHNDHLGTPRMMTNQMADVVWTAPSMPFGELDTEQNDLEQDNPLRFPGQYADVETGYSYNYFRDYDPSLGRYIQSDPIGLAGGVNTFEYVLGNPLSLIDPFGLAPPKDIPPEVNIAENIRLAQNMSAIDFYNTVKPGGAWDYKQLGSQYEEFGNYNYGVTGRAAGFSENTLLRMAGWAHRREKTNSEYRGHPLGKSPYGDDPKDQKWIKEGIKDYDEGRQSSDVWDDGNACIRG